MPYIYIPTPRLRKEIFWLIFSFVLMAAACIILYVKKGANPFELHYLIIGIVGLTVIFYGLWLLVRIFVVRTLEYMGYRRTTKEHRVHIIRRPSSDHEHHHHHHHNHVEK